MSGKFTSKRSKFDHDNAALIDMVTGHMAMDIEQHLKIDAGMPVKHGNMKAETRHFRSPNGGFRVEVDVAYAAYQERGMRADGTHVVKHYTYPGVSKGFFKRAIEMTTSKKDIFIAEAKRALSL